MLYVITGVSGSGKSEYAENLAGRLYQQIKEEGRDKEKALSSPANLYYIATMEPFGEEAKGRIERHHALRKEKGFTTIECYHHISRIFPEILPERESVVLLECMSNLLANELYRKDGMKEMGESVEETILENIKELEKKCRHLLVVTNETDRDGKNYGEETLAYMEQLGRINQELAVLADEVLEVVYSIPVRIK